LVAVLLNNPKAQVVNFEEKFSSTLLFGGVKDNSAEVVVWLASKPHFCSLAIRHHPEEEALVGAFGGPLDGIPVVITNKCI